RLPRRGDLDRPGGGGGGRRRRRAEGRAQKSFGDRSGQRPVERIDRRGGTGGHCRRAFGSWIPALRLSELVAPAAARGDRKSTRESQRSRRRGGAISLGALAAA